MPLHKCYYHFVWSTKHRRPQILPQFESLLFESVRRASDKLGAALLAVNAVPDHFHVAVSLPPSISVSTWVQRVKGTSSHDWNQAVANSGHRLEWQTGYSAFTFAERDLPSIIAYIRRQKQNHQARSWIAGMEGLDEE